MSAPTSSERRIQLRVPAKVSFIIRKPALDGVIYFMSRDLSIGGVFLSSELLLTEGTLIHLTFVLPGQKTPCSVVGEVVRNEEEMDEDNKMGMGIKFIDLSDSDRKTLEDYLAEQSQA